jgi:MinD-like ATPase involved in chromosome partitioning or flagellar assembly
MSNGIKKGCVMEEGISNYKLGGFIGKSEATIRNMKKDEPEEYDRVVKKYAKYLEEVALLSRKKVIAAINVKGGVGKSSILNITAPKANKSVILNIDFGAAAENVNSATTIDYAKIREDENLELNEVLDLAIEGYDNIFIDTPGDISSDFIDIIARVDHFILPFKPGKRTGDGTMETFHALFASGLVEGEHKLVVILNEYADDDEKERELASIMQAIEKVQLPKELSLDISYTSLKATKVMRTMENNAESIEQLSARSKIAYSSAYKRFNELSNDIITNLNLEAI